MQAPPEGGRAFVFDCDGVLLDSNAMKCEAFVEALARYPSDVVAAFSVHQRKSFGRSRYRLFEDFFQDFLDRPAEDGEMETLLDSFAAACRRGYEAAPMADGSHDFLSEAAREAALFVVSGSDQDELNEVFHLRGLDVYFAEILGSPTTKTDHLADLQARYPTHAFEVFFGDAEADFAAAENVGMRFHYISRYAMAPEAMTDLQARHRFSSSETLAGARAWLASR